MMSRRSLLAWWRPQARDDAAADRAIDRAVAPSVRATAIAAPRSSAPRLPPGLVPVIDTAACLATTTMCSVCVERCPRPGAIVVEAGRPRIVAAACDGCGQCLPRCPAPRLAIGLAPRAERS